MGGARLRGILCGGVIVAVAGCLAGCVPVYGVARDAIRAAQAPQTGELQRVALQIALDQRFRPQLSRMFPNSELGAVECPTGPDMSGYDITRCSMRIGSSTMPIIAQLNPTDRHLNSALALPVFRRAFLEKRISLQLYAAYGVRPRVRCPVAHALIPTPGFLTSCKLAGGIGRTADVFVLNTNGWTEPVAAPEPPDENEILLARKSDVHRVPGKLIAQLIFHRQNAILHALGRGDSIGEVSCGKKIDLSERRITRCGADFDGQYVAVRTMFANNRVTYSTEGAVVNVSGLTKEYASTLRQRYHSGPGVRITIDCHAQRVLVVANLGYHWCEIHAPAGYPKRLVLAELDQDGHYDAFFSDYSQAAKEH